MDAASGFQLWSSAMGPARAEGRSRPSILIFAKYANLKSRPVE